jgi:hypothetical protein
MKLLLLLLVLILTATGCNYEDVPPTHRGRIYERAVMAESRGFIGNVLEPGTRNIGFNNELYLLQCTEMTVREPFPAPSKNGVTFTADVYVRFSVNCAETKAVTWLFDNVTPGTFVKDAPKKEGPVEEDQQVEKDEYELKTITTSQLFAMYARPTLGAAVRTAMSEFQSDEINQKRGEIARKIEENFLKNLSGEGDVPRLMIHQVDLSNIGFPQSMQKTMEDLANVKTEVELEKEKKNRTDQEISTEKARKELEQVRASKSAIEVVELGRAMRENPEYAQYVKLQAEAVMMRNLPEAIGKLGSTPGTVILGESPTSLFLGERK